MSRWKAITALSVLAVLLWFLHPTRTPRENVADENVVEIVYMSPGGVLGNVMLDGIREFERLSREAHAKNPAKPIYRVLTGKMAVRDLSGDPSRLLLSIAGECLRMCQQKT